MIIMAVDYGDVRTGIAFCDKNEVLASPFTVITESYLPKLADKICSLALDNKAEKIIVGLPKNMDGTFGYRCDKCKKLGELITEKARLEVDFQDERLTTVMAHSFLNDNNLKTKKHKKNVDAVSASIILQSYIDKNKRG